MRSTIVLVLLTFLVPPLGAQQAGPSPPTAGASQEKCAIEGNVVNSRTGEPVRKATVTLFQMETNQSRSVNTDVAGRFIFNGLAAGRYQLWAERNGYVRQNYEAHGQAELRVEPGRDVKDIGFRLTPTGAITGRVADENGDPLNGAAVQLLRQTYADGERQFNQFGGGSTNDLGEYRLAGLEPGRYYLLVTYASGYGTPTPGDEAYEPVFYPGTPDPDRAVVVDVHPGDEIQGMDFNLVPTPAFTIRGRLIRPFSGGSGGWIALMKKEGGKTTGFQNYPVMLMPEGNFEIHSVTPGSYVLVGQWASNNQQLNGGSNQQYSGRLDLEVTNSDLDGVNLALSQGSDISGRVRIDGDTKHDFSGLQVSLTPREPPTMGVEPVTVRSDGTFTLKHVFDGVYRVYLGPLPQDFYLQSARFAGQEVLDSDFTISSSESGSVFDLVVSPAAGHLEGIVSSQQQPAAGALVVLVPDANRGNSRRASFVNNTDASGHFTIESVVPGDYLAFALGKGDSVEWQNPEFLARYKDRSKPISVGKGSRLSTQLELIVPEEAPQ